MRKLTAGRGNTTPTREINASDIKGINAVKTNTPLIVWGALLSNPGHSCHYIV